MDEMDVTSMYLLHHNSCPNGIANQSIVRKSYKIYTGTSRIFNALQVEMYLPLILSSFVALVGSQCTGNDAPQWVFFNYRFYIFK